MEKKNIFTIVGIIVILAIGIVSCVIVFTDKDETPSSKNNDKTNEVADDKNKEQNNGSETPETPAANTEELLTKMSNIEVSEVTNNSITFDEETEIEEGEKIAVWVYSTPKFLGFFEVVIEDGIKKIEGLAEKLEQMTIEEGEHNIALVTEEGSPIGYIDIFIEKSGEISKRDEEKDKEDDDDDKKETTTKEITVNEKIAYKTKTENEVNQQKGKKVVSQKGVNGTKEVTYTVTYDSNGKEISRKKVSEKTTKKAVDEIVKVGTSDFNINTDKITGSLIGFMCLENETLTDPDGTVFCDDSKNLKGFTSVTINTTDYLIEVDEVAVTPVKLTSANGMVNKGTYKGSLYYFDARGGSAGEPLTLDFCKKYNLACGAW